MQHEKHPCGLNKVVPERSATGCGLRPGGTAGPAWGFVCSILHFAMGGKRRTAPKPLVRDHQPVLRAASSRNSLQAEIPVIRMEQKAL